MAIEQFANNPVGTLNGAINNSVTSLVLSLIGNFPTSGNYRIKIDNEYMLVTGVSGTTLTVTRGIEGSSAASHVDQSAVYGVLTALALTTAFPQLGVQNTFVDGQIIQSGSGHIGVDIKANGADIIDLRDSSGTIRSSFDSSAYGFVHQFTFGLALGTLATTGTDKTNWLTATRAGKLIKCFMSAKTAPTGADLICDILKSTDNGATFTTIWTTTGNRIKITATNKTGTQTSFDTTAFNEGDIFRCDIAQVGSTIAGQDITIHLMSVLRNN